MRAVGQLADFEVNQHKTFENEVVEDHIHVKIVIAETDMPLAGNEAEAFAEFQRLIPCSFGKTAQIGVFWWSGAKKIEDSGDT